MRLTSPLRLAIYNGVEYKHWSLFIDGRAKSQKIILHMIYCSGWKFEERNLDASKSGKLNKMMDLCDVYNSQVNEIVDIAQDIIIPDTLGHYNCQDYILDLLDALEEKGVIDGKDVIYQKNRKAVEKLKQNRRR
ncbi:hypothetical protein ASPZODRAFT_143853 [Penicilliopsis zonata CBS 506.65]|uniref:Uncharacterized protein n=1 Tax=Penicilliopsis zonata CBS 506.65 TaxID=1073090 RepID=A0A1L9SDA5_9EURO|nr:hypothetical protein ASPZODRAFT_143853 [Penicilliopsis zonata CBS 506.65]OJJ45205.1 hypothetical protein ASPZODRAFT_143853 [Penicilliopsis zonata CBS 506.65]